MQSIADNANGVYSFAYDVANKMTTTTRPNGVSTSHEYDGMSRLARLKHQSNTATLFDYNYVCNTASQITGITEPSVARTFGYDSVDRLTSATMTNQPNESYSFDGVGNRTSSHLSATYGYQPFNRLSSTTTASYTFDNNGNMTSKNDSSGKWYYSCDAENRLTNATKFGGLIPRAGENIVYQYDALGRRVVRQDKKTGRTEFTHDGMDVLQDRNSDGTTTNYVNGLGIDNKLKQTTGTTSRYFLTDHLGSTMGMADSSGNIAESAIYDSFGRTISSTLTTRYQYTGREYDEYTGLMFYRARFYDPQIGRFISEDPIGFRGGINQFTYVGNDPLIYIDPYGYQGTYSGYQGMPTPRMWPPLPRAGEDSLLGQGNSPVLPPRDPYWRDPNDVAWEAQFKRFKEIDPYGGAYRHCVAACLLKRYQGPIGILQRHLWDWFHENPNDLNSIGDMYGEDTGLDCADKNGPCEVECLHKYPSPVQEGESPRWVPGGSIPTWE